tara:strand:+ start:2674 stop:3048 length:375 start_codon:yes stop_codon:yes gene_type:complete
MNLMGRPAKTPQPAYGQHLAELRKAAGFSQQRLADILDTRQSTIASWEHSDSPPKGSALPGLAEALGVSLDTLLQVEEAGKARHRGPSSRVESLLDRVSQLPRKRQQRIANVIEALLTEEAKAS